MPEPESYAALISQQLASIDLTLRGIAKGIEKLVDLQTPPPPDRRAVQWHVSTPVEE